jgi:uncharacterized membrane protein
MTITQPQTGVTNQQVSAYLAALASHLAPITLAEREDILREIGAHIRDSVEGGVPVETVLAGLGTPQILAEQYRDGALIREASRSLSPVLLLKATLRLAAKGAVGVLLFLAAFTGYTTSIGLFLMGVLKPFMPNSVGMWSNRSVGPNTTSSPNPAVAFGIQPHSAPHELLGWWAIPIGIVSGIVLFAVTTLAVRYFVRLSRNARGDLNASAAHS